MSISVSQVSQHQISSEEEYRLVITQEDAFPSVTKAVKPGEIIRSARKFSGVPDPLVDLHPLLFVQFIGTRFLVTHHHC